MSIMQPAVALYASIIDDKDATKTMQLQYQIEDLSEHYLSK
jgi:hypothetical protein